MSNTEVCLHNVKDTSSLKKRIDAYCALFDVSNPTVKISGTFQTKDGEFFFSEYSYCVVKDVNRKYITVIDQGTEIAVMPYESFSVKLSQM